MFLSGEFKFVPKEILSQEFLLAAGWMRVFLSDVLYVEAEEFCSEEKLATGFFFWL